MKTMRLPQSVTFGFAVLALGSLVGCGNSVSKNIQQAVSDNQKAKSLIEWEQSEANPEALFSQWREDVKSDSTVKANICDELKNLPAQALTIFEEQLSEKENASLVSDCDQDLKTKLDGHYAAEREKMEVPLDALKPLNSSNRFQFPTNIQKRDLSQGYFAVTGDVAKKEVIITFDDGPSGVYTESILRSLKEVNAKAIFFHLAKSVNANPEIVKKVAADGHAVGSHSITHACLGTKEICRKNNGRILSFDEAVAEIKGGHQAVYNAIGWVDPFFRFPYGESSNELKAYLGRSQVGEFYWSIDSEDWKAQTNENMIKNTLAQLDARGRGIILFHDIQRKTAESLPQLLKEIYQRGYSIVLLQSADPAARFNSPLVKKNLP